MKPGDVVAIRVPSASGPAKPRPALVLSVLPGNYGDLLVCGVSTQMWQEISGWDEVIQPGDADYPTSGLHQASLIRLSFLYAADPGRIIRLMGRVEPARLERLQRRLADHIHP